MSESLSSIYHISGKGGCFITHPRTRKNSMGTLVSGIYPSAGNATSNKMTPPPLHFLTQTHNQP